MRRMMLLGALVASLLATPAFAEPGEARGWHNRERIERQINRDHDRSNRERDRHNRELDRRNRELDKRNRELDRAQNEFYRREAERDRKWYDHNRHDHRRHDHRHDDRHRHRDFWTRERAWHQHHHHHGHWDTGLRFYVFENRRYVYHPYFAESDPFVRDEYGNCYRVEYHGDSRVLRQVRSKYCRWS